MFRRGRCGECVPGVGEGMGEGDVDGAGVGLGPARRENNKHTFETVTQNLRHTQAHPHQQSHMHTHLHRDKSTPHPSLKFNVHSFSCVGLVQFLNSNSTDGPEDGWAVGKRALSIIQNNIFFVGAFTLFLTPPWGSPPPSPHWGIKENKAPV